MHRRQARTPVSSCLSGHDLMVAVGVIRRRRNAEEPDEVSHFLPGSSLREAIGQD